ncbi:hypothetical protein [Mycobacteroides abscessus]|uniref:hypothetical protein n=1 Tax=Mycobacteroides abscessus TaxID=36809 RepID=UPI0013F65ABE|nr:hypothetical protein [Mycobacteroides abscessus]
MSLASNAFRDTWRPYSGAVEEAKTRRCRVMFLWRSVRADERSGAGVNPVIAGIAS